MAKEVMPDFLYVGDATYIRKDRTRDGAAKNAEVEMYRKKRRKRMQRIAKIKRIRETRKRK